MHGGAAAGANGFALSGALNDLTKLVSNGLFYYRLFSLLGVVSFPPSLSGSQITADGRPGGRGTVRDMTAVYYLAPDGAGPHCGQVFELSCWYCFPHSEPPTQIYFYSVATTMMRKRVQCSIHVLHVFLFGEVANTSAL